MDHRSRNYSDLDETLAHLRSRIPFSPHVGLVLGSGLGDFADTLSDRTIFSTSEIPHYPVSSVPGHAGKIVFGIARDHAATSGPLVVFQGRVHLYETGDLQKVIFPIEVAAQLGVKILIITNAAGAINPDFHPGDLMLIRDFINLAFENPLRAITTHQRSVSERPVMDHDLCELAKSIAQRNHIAIKDGIYCWTKGPSYETASEIRMMKSAGADAVGMSTVPEILRAYDLGMKVLGISCITNMGTGISDEKLNHDEVTEVANKVKAKFTTFITQLLLSISQ